MEPLPALTRSLSAVQVPRSSEELPTKVGPIIFVLDLSASEKELLVNMMRLNEEIETCLSPREPRWSSPLILDAMSDAYADTNDLVSSADHV